MLPSIVSPTAASETVPVGGATPVVGDEPVAGLEPALGAVAANGPPPVVGCGSDGGLAALAGAPDPFRARA